jgi:hypothetical protein
LGPRENKVPKELLLPLWKLLDVIGEALKIKDESKMMLLNNLLSLNGISTREIII